MHRTPLPFLVALLVTLVAVPAARAQTAPPAPPPPDTTPPVLSDVIVSAAVVKASETENVRFTLNEIANVAGAVSEHRSGRLVSGKCVPGAAIKAAGKHRRTRRPCTKLVRLGSFFVANAPAGPNIVKLGLKALRPARYQVTLTPRDRTGNLGAVATVELRVAT